MGPSSIIPAGHKPTWQPMKPLISLAPGVPKLFKTQKILTSLSMTSFQSPYNDTPKESKHAEVYWRLGFGKGYQVNVEFNTLLLRPWISWPTSKFLRLEDSRVPQFLNLNLIYPSQPSQRTCAGNTSSPWFSCTRNSFTVLAHIVGNRKPDDQAFGPIFWAMFWISVMFVRPHLFPCRKTQTCRWLWTHLGNSLVPWCAYSIL